MKTEMATVAEKVDMKAVENMGADLSVVDGLSQLSIPKSFGVREKKQQLGEEAEEEGEEEAEEEMEDSALMMNTPAGVG